MISPSRLLAVIMVALTPAATGAQVSTAAEPANDSRLAWFNQARFGLFVHWGLYAIPAGEWHGQTDYGEWIMLQGNVPMETYEGYAAQFNPTRFNAAEWVALAKEAGMGYLVMTAKHHDGFCLFDSNYTHYDIVDASPFHRDPLQELSAACHQAGLTFCTYYSIVDWHHPEFPREYSQVRREFPDGYHGRPNPQADIGKYATYLRQQVRELLTNYGDNGILWFDGGGSFRNRDRRQLLDGEKLVNMIHELQPGCLINNRLGFGADYGTPEQEIPEAASTTPFEVCMTLNRHWGYNRHDHDWKSAETVIRNLCDIASKGGNYLLNVGPTAEGVIPPESVAILKTVGAWMKTNGDAIHGTQAGPSRDTIRLQPDGRMTTKPGKLFLHVFNWPKDGRLFLEGMKGDIVTKAYLLADPARKPLGLERHERSLFISVPALAPDPIASVVVVEYAPGETLEIRWR